MRSVRRTLEILEVVARSPDGIRLADVSRRTGLDGSTSLRFLGALERMRYVVRDQAGTHYHLGPRIANLGLGPALGVLTRVAKVHMKNLQRICGEDVNLGTLDAGLALTLETQKSSHILGVNFVAGLRMPAYASSMGKAILAFMPEDRRLRILSEMHFETFTPTTIANAAALQRELELVAENGYSVDRQEFTPGVVCIGTPVFDANGDAIAAISISAPDQRISIDELVSKYVEPLKATGQAISADLRGVARASGQE